MVKGVNRQVVEVVSPTCEYFERVLFFVKPEWAGESDGTLRARADLIAQQAGKPPVTLRRRSRGRRALALAGAALGGALVSALLFYCMR